jgi:lipoprotein-releasing system permease protein
LNLPFLKYFLTYLFHAKTRQKLLFLAVFGLIISSFALLVLQSTMGGLQNKLISRSKEVSGHFVAEFKPVSEDSLFSLAEELAKDEIIAIPEYELELLVKYGSYYAPMIVHGIKPTGVQPPFLRGRVFEELLLPRGLAIKINATVGDLVRLMSPAHLESFIGDVPKMSSLYLNTLVRTEVLEIDDFHGWASLRRMQTFSGRKEVNRVRFFSDAPRELLEQRLKGVLGKTEFNLFSWEQKNATLVWALGLETTVMVFLFSAMTLLVSLAITSALLIFFSKIKSDLASFWIMGTDEASIIRSSKVLLALLSFCSAAIGIGLGVGFLYALDHLGPNIMPDVFVDRKIPVHITGVGLATSFGIPFFISLIFAFLSLKAFQKDIDYMRFIRSIG